MSVCNYVVRSSSHTQQTHMNRHKQGSHTRTDTHRHTRRAHVQTLICTVLPGDFREQEKCWICVEVWIFPNVFFKMIILLYFWKCISALWMFLLMIWIHINIWLHHYCICHVSLSFSFLHFRVPPFCLTLSQVEIRRPFLGKELLRLQFGASFTSTMAAENDS